MAKDLSQLSLEELWHLFPIFLVAPKDQWETNYQEMAVRLEQVLGDLPLVRISHIGSTAIPGIWAKDIVDVLVELAPQADLRLASDRLIQSGFLKM
uniref:GrpB family protein n=1 Tax=uncultured Abiotrophia sp. TaxID=316094 RepID=UPI00288C0A1B